MPNLMPERQLALSKTGLGHKLHPKENIVPAQNFTQEVCCRSGGINMLSQLVFQRTRTTILALLAIVWLTGAPASNLSAQTAIALPAFKTEDVPLRGLDANLYMQTAAEYRACCYQAYNLATYRLKEKAAEARAKDKDVKLAVVMDLDETVFDNAGFQATQLRSGFAYDQCLWDLWEKSSTNKLGFIPGAHEFITAAQNLNVSVIYISNRSEKLRAEAKQSLATLGIPIQSEDQLLLSTDSSDKTARREATEKNYTVLLYVGDNLRDFKESYKCPSLGQRTPPELQQAIDARKKAVTEDRDLWGDKFIILPNPAYGEWAKPLGNGKADLDLLVPAK